jgi:hypothetical protein
VVRLAIMAQNVLSVHMKDVGLASVGRLSYMLTDDLIKQAKASARLVAAKPMVPWAPEQREFLMCQPLYQAIQRGRLGTDEKTLKRWAQLVDCFQR